jgi:hypothetical protein
VSYAPPGGSGVPFNFTGAYTPPGGGAVNGDFTSLPDVAYVNGAGFDASNFGTASCGNVSPNVAPSGSVQDAFGTATLANKARVLTVQWPDYALIGAARVSNVQTITATGLNPTVFGTIYDVVLGYYSPPFGSSVPFNFVGAYSPPLGNALPMDFQNTHVFRQLVPSGINTGAFGGATVYNVAQGITGQGLASFSAGTPTIYNAEQAVVATGIGPGSVGTQFIWLKTRWITAPGIGSFASGTADVENWRRYITPNGLLSQVFGTAQFPWFSIEPSGISPGSMGTLKVDPRILYAQGFSSVAWGGPSVQPNPHPSGFDSALFGTAYVHDSKQYVDVGGFDASDVPQPTATLMRTYLYPPSLVESGIFGDVAVKNYNQYILAEGVAPGLVTPWADVENRNWYTLPYGIAPGSFGDGDAIANVSPNLTPYGIGPETFGPETDVGFHIKYVYPTQIAPGVVGSGASIVNLAQGIAPPGIAAVADPHLGFIAPAVRELRDVGGTDTSSFSPSTWVSLYRRTFTNIGAGDVSFYGTAVVESTIRMLSGAGGVDSAVLGTPTTWFRVRDLAPASIAYAFTGLQFGGTRIQYALQSTAPYGIPPGDVGALTIARNERYLAPPSILGAVGVPDVEWLRRYVDVRSSPEQTLYGTPKVYNLLQVVNQVFDEPTRLLQGGVGDHGDVENRNRTILTYGTNMSKVPTGAQVLNNARVLAAEGDDVSAYGNALVAPRVRYLLAQGDDMSFFVQWHAVWNLSSQLYPSGIGHGYVGVPYVFRDDQTIDLNGTRTLFTEFGGAMVDFAIRTVTLDPHNWGIPPGTVPGPTRVSNATQYAAPAGIAAGAVGGHVLEIHFNIAAPHGQQYTVFGGPAVRNVTPEVHPSTWGEFDTGRATVGLYTRYVNAAGFTALQFGSAYVGPRTRYVAPNGILGLRIPLTHQVWFDAPQLPPQQTIVEAPWPVYVHDDPAQYGLPYMDRRSIIQLPWNNGADPASFGHASVRTNVISNVTIPLDEDFSIGRPTLNPTQYITSPTYDNNDEPALYGTPHIWPYYLRISEDFWGRLVKPEAIVDFTDSETDPFNRPVFGSSTVSNSRRSIAPFHRGVTDDFTIGEVLGTPEVSLRVRTIYLTGWKGKFGFPVMIGGNLLIEQFNEDADTEVVFGQADVEYAPSTSPYVNPVGRDSSVFGQADVELFNRTLTVPGWYSFNVTGDTSVHPPVVMYPSGADDTAFGTTWVSNRIRTLVGQGFDADEWDYELGSGIFSPLHVWLRYTPKPAGMNDEAVPMPRIGIDPNFRGAVAGVGDTSTYGKPRVGACAC